MPTCVLFRAPQCSDGYTNNAQHTDCVPCGRGMYSNGNTGWSCQACPSGQVSYPSAISVPRPYARQLLWACVGNDGNSRLSDVFVTLSCYVSMGPARPMVVAPLVLLAPCLGAARQDVGHGMLTYLTSPAYRFTQHGKRERWSTHAIVQRGRCGLLAQWDWLLRTRWSMPVLSART